MFCQKCGTQNPDNAVFCSKCGNKFISIKSENDAQKPYTHVENSTHEQKQEPTGKLLHTIKKFRNTYEIYDNKIIHKPLIGKIEYPFDKVVRAEFKNAFIGGVITLKKSDGTSKEIPGLLEKDAEEIFKYIPFEHSIQKTTLTQSVTILIILFVMLGYMAVYITQSDNIDNTISSIVSQPKDASKEYIDIYLFIDTVGLTNKTNLQRQEFYDSSVGKYIIHKAIVKDVTKNNIILSVDNRDTRIYLNVIENQKSEMLSLKKGDMITFEGMITSDTKYFEQSTSWPVFYPFSLDLFNGKIISKN